MGNWGGEGSHERVSRREVSLLHDPTRKVEFNTILHINKQTYRICNNLAY